MRSLTLRVLVVLATALTLACVARAGQLFVDVGSPVNRYNPANTGVVSVGDFVIWTWAASGHTVTSGSSGTVAGDGTFNSDPGGTTRPFGTVYAWKTNGAHSYYCQPHFPFGMTGAIFTNVAQPEADLRITEVRFDGVDNFVEIGNLLGIPPAAPGATGNLAGFRLSINGGAPITLSPQSIPEGGFVKLTPPGLTTSGSVALYAPYLANSLPGTGSLQESDWLVDYVEWGQTGGQPLENVAGSTVSPSIWTAGQFAPQVATGHSIMFCGARFQYGALYWAGALNPTPGLSNDCPNPTIPTTWGRLKTLYR